MGCSWSWDTASLLINRLSLLVVAGFGLVTLLRLLLAQSRNPLKRAVPRPVVFFTIFWMGVLFFVSVLLLLTCSPALTTATRTLFGASLAWSLGGAVWMLALGNRHLHKVRDSDISEVFIEAIRSDSEHNTLVEEIRDIHDKTTNH